MGFNYSDFKILMVDDDELLLNSTKRVLEHNGMELMTEASPAKALEYLKANKVDFILLDFNMPEMTGKEFLDKLKEFDKKTVVALHSAYTGPETPQELVDEWDIQAFLDKNMKVEDKILTVKALLKTIDMARTTEK